jgi:hypothetical protein
MQTTQEPRRKTQSRSSRLSVDVNTNTNTNSDSNNNEEAHESTPPLETAAAAGVLDTFGDLHVGIAQVVVRLLGLLRHVLNGLPLLEDLLVQKVHEVQQFADRSLNPQELVVARLDVAQHLVCEARAVALELYDKKSLLEKPRPINPIAGKGQKHTAV